jgi:acyl carrier protein
MTPREREVSEEILRIARHELGLDWRGSDDDDLRDRLDSLALLTLVVAVEDRFRVRLDEVEGVAVRSLSDLARLVAARRAEVEAAGVEP